MSVRSHPVHLQGLTTREQIADVIIRACLAIDINDRTLWESAWATEEPTFELNGKLYKGLDSINGESFNVVGPMDTQHQTTSLRVEVEDGASTAHLTAWALNQHFRAGQGMVPGSPFLLVGHSYDIDLIKESSGQWRMQTWRIKTVWYQGTWDVLKPEASK